MIGRTFRTRSLFAATALVGVLVLLPALAGTVSRPNVTPSDREGVEGGPVSTPGDTVPSRQAPPVATLEPDSTPGSRPEPAARSASPVVSTAAEAIAAAEDHDFRVAQAWVDRALEIDHTSFGPRALALWIEMARSPDRFVETRPKPLPGPAEMPPRGRLEACWHATFALYLSRDLYRGDREEDAEAFIERVTGEAEAVLETLDSVEDPAAVPWKAFLRTMLLHLLHRPPDARLHQALEGAPEPWGLWLRLLAIDRRAVDWQQAFTWLDSRLEDSANLPFPLRARVLLAKLRLQAGAWDDAGACRLYEAQASSFPPGRYRDDFELAWGQALAECRPDEAEARLRPLTTGHWRNTTFDATKKLGEVLYQQERYREVLDLYRAFRERHPRSPGQFYRGTGKALAALGQHEKAVDAFQRSIEGPRGRGQDYAYLANSLRKLPEVDPAAYDWKTVRAEAMTLVDFAADAVSRELRVLGWTHDFSTELECRLVKPASVLFHAVLFPLTFSSVGLMVLSELLAVSLGLVAFVSYPRLARKTWPGVAITSAVLLAPALPVLAGALSSAENLAIHGAWLLQAGARVFFLMAGAVLLSPSAHTQGLATIRGFRRSLRRGDTARWLRRAWPLAATAAVLATLSYSAALHGRTPSPYFERFPTLMTIAELGATPVGGSDPTRILLSLFSVIRLEILARGLLLTALAYLFRRRKWGRVVAIGTGALLATFLFSGTMEPAPVQAAVTLVQGILLGVIRFRHGVDGAVFAHLAAFLLSGGNP